MTDFLTNWLTAIWDLRAPEIGLLSLTVLVCFLDKEWSR